MDEMNRVGNDDLCRTLQKNIDDALNSAAGAMLSQKQFDEVARLRKEIQRYCEAGLEDVALQLEMRAMSIIRQCAPSRG